MKLCFLAVKALFCKFKFISNVIFDAFLYTFFLKFEIDAIYPKIYPKI